MKDIYKLALLLIIFAVSMIPLVYFLATAGYGLQFVNQLLWGKAHAEIDVPKDKLMIVSHIVLGVWITPLSYMVEVVLSAIVFLVSLGLIARLLYKMSIKTQRKRASYIVT